MKRLQKNNHEDFLLEYLESPKALKFSSFRENLKETLASNPETQEWLKARSRYYTPENYFIRNSACFALTNAHRAFVSLAAIATVSIWMMSLSHPQKTEIQASFERNSSITKALL